MSNNFRPIPPSFGHKALTAFLSASLCLSLTPAQAFAADDATVDTASSATEAPAQATPESAPVTADATTPVAVTSASESTEKPSEVAAPVAAAPVAAPEASASRTADDVATNVLWIDGTAGADTNTGAGESAALKTFTKALELQKANPAITKIMVKGNFTNVADVTIPSGVSVVITSNVNMTGTKKNGITLQSGASLSALNGATLTMTDFNTALTVAKGATLSDGHYVFKNNGVTSFYVAGTVRGSAGRDKLTITADANELRAVHSGDMTFENCTVSLNSQTRTWYDGIDLNLKNASYTTAGYGMGNYVNRLNMTDSEMVINTGSSWRYSTGLAIQDSSTITNSRIVVNAGSTAGISVGGASTVVTIANSTLEFNNGGVGGFNINTGKVILTDSTIKGNGKNSGALYGAQKNGQITFVGNSHVETPATKDAHTGAAEVLGGHVVLGGSYRVSYAPDYNSSAGSTVPTNGVDNGNEKLMLFTLANPATAQLSPLNSAGQSYIYPVSTPSEDGQKHVWVPAEKVTFTLNEPGTQNAVSASFKDGATKDKEALAIRGYLLSDAKPAAGTNVVPENPSALGYDFEGWFYKNNGAETPFDATAVNVSSPITVYAKWKENGNSYGIIYHSNTDATDVTYTEKGTNADRSAQVADHKTVSSANTAFTPKGKIFKGWNTKADGQGENFAPNQTITVPANKPSIDLYAQWEDQMATVRFSANGGIFSDDSVFKKNPEVFEISTDDKGGEVATVKAKSKVLDEKLLDDVLKSLKPDVTTATDGLASPEKDSAADKAFANIATKKYSVLDYKSREKGFFFVTTYHDYWYTDANGKNATTLSNGTKVNNDITYYLKWKSDPSIEEIKKSFNIDGDIFSDSIDTSAETKFVSVDKETFSLTGQVDAKSIQDQMQAIQALYPTIQESDYKNIQIDGATSTFTAKITVPDGVKIPDNPTITTKGLGNAFTVQSTEVNGQTVTVVFKLVDGITNYQELKDAVDSTGMDGAVGNTRPISVMVDGLTLDGAKLSNGQELVATGTVEGSFNATASVTNGKTKKFDFSWKATQSDTGRDKKAKDNDTIQYTIVAVKQMAQTIPADLLINDDSTNNSVYGVLPGQKIGVTGAVNIKSIKDQMAAIEALYPNTPQDQITVQVKDFNFSAKLTLPAGMTMPQNLTPDTLELKDFGGFKVTKVDVQDNVATVSMALSDNITTYDQLKKAVDTAGSQDGWMKLTIPNVLVNADVAEGKLLTAKAEVTGSFDALATHGNTTKPFSFMWTGEQWADGKDSIASDVTTIQATAQTPHTITATLPADILVGDNTEHDEIYTTTSGSTVDYTGALNVNAIKEQMANIEKLYPGVDQSQIMVNVADCTFTASFEVPEGITLPSNIQVSTNNFGDAFEVANVQTSGNKVTVTMKLKDGFTKYTDLQDAVAKAGDADGWMKLILHGVKVNDDVTPGTKLTVVGTIAGAMKATATTGGGHSKAFSFVWNGEQWADGKDATTDASDTSISFTLTVKAPENPDTPNQPDQPSNPGNKKPQIRPQDKGKSKKVLPKTGDAAMGAGVFASMVAGIAALGAHFGIRRKDNED
ncbi:InlB B-repeat-containing protein [Atopobium fossor]|uniref:InlB B-repeat-containing protein n=1 Tax=Atopobium fossor TaxID=39487 RepID=UPI0003FE37B9|nr:InlB B-repeat-containing protein [Atopobium fossor]